MTGNPILIHSLIRPHTIFYMLSLISSPYKDLSHKKVIFSW
jgi:hypothetical protein